MASFAKDIICWQKKNGRHHLPWQLNNHPYPVWLSEVMLQQTQVQTVIPYFLRFLKRFPDVGKLARAQENSVLAIWSGLGYYARARNLHRSAKWINTHHFPSTATEWECLPGIGKSTAASIMIFTQQERLAILDGNVKRILARVYCLDLPLNQKLATEKLWILASNLLPHKKNIQTYTQGLMDLGSSVCIPKKPLCNQCPVKKHCLSFRNNKCLDYPMALPVKKSKPQKNSTLLCLRYQNKVFLEKRPTNGIWGGLWSFPEASSEEKLFQNLKINLKVEKRTMIKHEFTHYRLHAKILTCHVETLSTIKTGKWYNIQSELNIGLPAPIRKFLDFS